MLIFGVIDEVEVKVKLKLKIVDDEVKSQALKMAMKQKCEEDGQRGGLWDGDCGDAIDDGESESTYLYGVVGLGDGWGLIVRV